MSKNSSPSLCAALSTPVSLLARCGHDGEQGWLPRSGVSQVWDSEPEKTTEFVSEGCTGHVAFVIGQLSLHEGLWGAGSCEGAIHASYSFQGVNGRRLSPLVKLGASSSTFGLILASTLFPLKDPYFWKFLRFN